MTTFQFDDQFFTNE